MYTNKSVVDRDSDNISFVVNEDTNIDKWKIKDFENQRKLQFLP